jgi:hypothetical protein
VSPEAADSSSDISAKGRRRRDDLMKDVQDLIERLQTR